MNNPMKFTNLVCALGLIGLIACSEPDDKTDKLEIRTSSPITIAVGDTCPLLIVSRTTTGATGRTTTTNPYRNFGLVSRNPQIATIAVLQRIQGMVPGETKVVARDESSSLVSDSITVIVIPKP
jgi:hypothetical protein